MLRLSSLLALILVVLSGLSFAQDRRQEVAALNKSAVDALTAKKFDEGIGFLTKILEIQPKDKGTAYNMACAYSLKGDPDKSFEWLDKAVEWGWGKGNAKTAIAARPTELLTEVEMLKKDTDFDAVRKDPRFTKIVDRLEKESDAQAAALKKGEEFASKPAVYIPEKAAALKEMPILVVLHDTGSTKDAVIQGRWKAVADELGFALIAPSGKIPVGDDPSKGMAWFGNRDDYEAKYFVYEKPVNDAVSAFQKDHAIDKTRVVVAGEGNGGLVALNVAINSPALYRGVVTLNGKFSPELYAGKAPNAGKMGVKVELLLDTAAVPKDAPPDSGAEKMAAAENKSLQTWGVPGEAKAFTADPKDADHKRLLVEAVHAVLTPSPASASAPK